MSRYDFVVVGSSPGMIVEAILAAKRNKAVALFESQAELGGAWRPVEWRNRRFDRGPHIFYPNPRGEKKLQSLGVLTEKVAPEPLLYSSRKFKFFKDNNKNVIMLTQGKDRSSFKDLIKLPLRLIKASTLDFLFGDAFYLQGGSEKLIAQLEIVAERQGVQIFKNATVDEIEFANKKLKIKSKTGEFLSEKAIISPNYSGRFLKDKNNIHVVRETLHTNQMLIVCKKLETNFSFITFVDNLNSNLRFNDVNQSTENLVVRAALLDHYMPKDDTYSYIGASVILNDRFKTGDRNQENNIAELVVQNLSDAYHTKKYEIIDKMMLRHTLKRISRKEMNALSKQFVGTIHIPQTTSASTHISRI